MDNRGARIRSALARKVAAETRALSCIAGGRELTVDETGQLAGLHQVARDLDELRARTPSVDQRPARGGKGTLSAHTLSLLCQHLPGALDRFEGADRLTAVEGILAIMSAIEAELGASKQPAPIDRAARACLDHLLAVYAAPRGSNDRRSFAEWIEAARSGTLALRTANQVLGRYGVAVEIDDPSPNGNGSWLCVSNSHRRTVELFAGTLWAKRRRRRPPWSLALRQIPGARAVGSRRFGGYGTRATAIPLDFALKEAGAG